MRLLFQSKANRDQRVRELRYQGFRVRRSSIRNQQLHPEYVADWQGSVERGPGNTQYRTFFSTLYILETDIWR